MLFNRQTSNCKQRNYKEEVQENTEKTGDSGTNIAHEYEELLAYIKENWL
jgi:hypothetical protein